MRIARHRQTVTLAVVAVLVLATAWIAVGDRAATTLGDLSRVSHAERGTDGTVSPLDLTDAVVVPTLGAPRPIEPHTAPLWVLPGAAAALAALCLMRRQRLRPKRIATRVLLVGSLSNRAPPSESFA